jgi:hypothetical protein
MSEPKTDEETIIDAVGEPWPTDPTVYTIPMTDEQGNPVPLTFQWRANGFKLATPSGTLAGKDARAF